jgi:hypothetical protein
VYNKDRDFNSSSRPFSFFSILISQGASSKACRSKASKRGRSAAKGCSRPKARATLDSQPSYRYEVFTPVDIG